MKNIGEKIINAGKEIVNWTSDRIKSVNDALIKTYENVKDKYNNFRQYIDDHLSDISKGAALVGSGLLVIGGTALAIEAAPVIIAGGTVVTGTTIASVAGTGALMAGTVGIAAGLTEVRTGIEGYSLTGDKLDNAERTNRIISGIIDTAINIPIIGNGVYLVNLVTQNNNNESILNAKENKETTTQLTQEEVKNAKNIASQIKSNNVTPPNGFKGGHVFENIPRDESDQKLPEGIQYREYDVHPYVKGENRRAERIVIGDDGSVWYTNDHYHSFTRIDD